MTIRNRLGRDPFTFSLGGVTAANGYAFVPAVADAVINEKLAERALETGSGYSLAARIEDLLARYFAAGCQGCA